VRDKLLNFFLVVGLCLSVNACSAYTWVPIAPATTPSAVEKQNQTLLKTKNYCRNLGDIYHLGSVHSMTEAFDDVNPPSRHMAACMRSRGYKLQDSDPWERPLLKVTKNSRDKSTRIELHSWDWMGVTEQSRISYHFSAQASSLDKEVDPLVVWAIRIHSKTWSYLNIHKLSAISDKKRIRQDKPSKHKPGRVLSNGRTVEYIYAYLRLSEVQKLATGKVVRFKINSDVFEIPWYYQKFMRDFVKSVQREIAAKTTDPFDEAQPTADTAEGDSVPEPPARELTEEEKIDEALGL